MGGDPHVDACICGGTLGIFVALALQQKGAKTCIVEKRTVAGRTQEWNISRGEIQVRLRSLLPASQPCHLSITLFSPTCTYPQSSQIHPPSPHPHPPATSHP